MNGTSGIDVIFGELESICQNALATNKASSASKHIDAATNTSLQKLKALHQKDNELKKESTSKLLCHLQTLLETSLALTGASNFATIVDTIVDDIVDLSGHHESEKNETLSTEIEVLKLEIKRQDERLYRNNADFQKQQDYVKKLQTELTEETTQVQTHLATIASLQDELSRHSEAIGGSHAAQQSLKSELDSTKAELDVLVAKHSDFHGSHDVALEKKQSEIDTLKLNYDKKIQLLEKENYANVSQIEELNDQLAKLQSQTRSNAMVNRHAKKEADEQIDSLEFKVTQLTQNEVEMTERLTSLEGDYNKLRLEKVAVDSLVAELHEKSRDVSAEHASRINDLHEQLNEACRTKDVAEERLGALEDEIRILSASELGLNAEMQAKQAAEQRVRDLEGELASLKQQKATSDQRAEREAASVKAANDQYKSLVTQKDLVDREIMALGAELAAARATSKTSAGEVKDLKDQVGKGEAELKELQINMEKINEEKDTLRGALKRSKNAEMESQNLISDLESRLAVASRNGNGETKGKNVDIEINAKMNILEQQKAEALGRLQEIAEKLAEETHGNAILETKVAALEAQRKEQDTEMAVVQEDLEACKTENGALQNRVDALQKDLLKIRNNDEELKDAKDNVEKLSVEVLNLRRLSRGSIDMPSPSVATSRGSWAMASAPGPTIPPRDPTKNDIPSLKKENNELRSACDEMADQIHTLRDEIDMLKMRPDSQSRRPSMRVNAPMSASMSPRSMSMTTNRLGASPAPQQAIAKSADSDDDDDDGFGFGSGAAKSFAPPSELMTPTKEKTVPLVRRDSLGDSMVKPKPKMSTRPMRRRNSAGQNLQPTPTKDRRFELNPKNPIVLLEVGSFLTRVGIWNESTEEFEFQFFCRTMTAFASNDKNRFEVVRYASSQSDAMYQHFREQGFFVGKDAYYCLFDHPDKGLRSALKACPVIKNGNISDMNAFDKLLDHCVLKGLKMEDCSKAQVLMTYKITYDQQALNNIAVSMFDTLLCSKVCIISEAQLTVSSLAQLSSSSLKDSPSSVVVVDIGARETTVYPMYEGIEMKKNMVTTRVGGEHITDFLASMLYAKNDEAYNSQMPRRCKEIARHVKEQSAYVAMSYDAAQTTYGKFEFEKVQVMNEVMLQKSTSRRSLSAFSEDASVRDLAAQARRCQKADDIQKTVTTTLLDGTKIDFSIDIERFHCTEVLFNPSLFEDSRECISIVDAVRGAIDSVDELVRDDVRNHIVIAGGSSLLIGLSERLEKELKLKDSNVKVTIALEKDRPTNPSEWSSVAQGASVRVREALDPMKRGTQIDGFHFVTEADFETKGSGVFDTFHIT